MREHTGSGDHLHHRAADPGHGAPHVGAARPGSRNRLSRRAGAAALGATLAVALAACTPPSPLSRLSPSGQWATSYDAAQQAANGGRYDTADSILVQYIDGHEGTAEAADALFWRAMFALDPANRSGSTQMAIAELDRYLDGSPTLPHWREASTLRRLAAQLETATRVAAAAAQTQTSATRVAAADDRAKDDELNRLRAELAKANEELDRIKKRIAKP